MRTSYQGTEIWNEFPIKIAQFLNYFCVNCCFETLSFSKQRVTSVTHINLPVSIFLVHPFILVHPQQEFNAPWVEPFTLLRNAVLSSSFGIIRIRYTQNTQHRSHMSSMDGCFTRLVEGTVYAKNVPVPYQDIRYASKIALKYVGQHWYGTVKGARYVLRKF